jgi:trehalose 6-phosphate phosphatase
MRERRDAFDAGAATLAPAVTRGSATAGLASARESIKIGTLRIAAMQKPGASHASAGRQEAVHPMIDIGRIELATDETALFLDIDGTLIDLAPRPDGVFVPDSLKADLAGVYALLGGALALVSGRAVAEIDRLFSPLGLPASGVHGSEFRPVPPDAPLRLAPRIPDELRAKAIAIVGRHPGSLFEDKGIAIALHWRLAPQYGTAIEAEVAAMMEHAPPGLAALRGHSVIEIKGSALNKGMAVERFLQEPAFRGRRPVFVGDDVTDQAAFAAVTRYGGFAFAVGRAMEDTLDWFGSPSEVRRWLGQLVGGNNRIQAVA